MNKPGRKPEPLDLKIAKNNPGKRKLRPRHPAENEPMDARPPATLKGKMALAAWRRICDEAHWLRRADRHLCEVLCRSWEQWQIADTELVKIAKRGMPSEVEEMMAPYQKMTDNARTNVLKCLGELGMTPVARERFVPSLPRGETVKGEDFFS